MKDESKTKRQLIQELIELRQQIVKLEKEKGKGKQIEESLLKSEKEAKRLAQGNAVISEIGRIISSTLNIEEVYQRFAEEVRKVLLFDRVTINMVDVEENIVTVPYAAGIPAPGRQPGDNFPLAGTTTELSVKTRKGVILQLENENEIANHFPGLLPVFKAGLRSSMAVPLISKDQPIGVLHFASRKPNAYTDTDLKLAESIGAQIAGAIANAQLYRELKQAEQMLRKSEEESTHLAHENAIMAEIGRIISSTLNIDDVYELFTAAARKLIAFDRISVGLLDPPKDTITVVHIAGVGVEGLGVGNIYPLHDSASEIVM
ncbi:MAG: GAF domain-containing protein, partial [Proteobacteria bacterium]|nr:GAF domain-containing protein [Pseudomonadota bacterium]